MTERTTTADFVARGEAPNEWRIVLVEEGPWGDVDSELRRIQDRLYGCLDAAVDGKLAEQFPESKGSAVVLRLDCYNVPRAEVAAFFDRFSRGVLALPDYSVALAGNQYVQSIRFEITFDAIH